MKKIIALFLAAAVFVLAGCSDTNKDYSALLPFVNGSSDNKIEVTLALADNDSRMITGSPAASTADAYNYPYEKYIKVEITDKDEKTLCEKDNIQTKGKISLYIDKVNFDNLKAATVTVTGYTEKDGDYQEFTKGIVSGVDLTLGKTIYVPMEYIVTENEAGHSGNITFSVGYYNQADWENNGFDVSKVEGTPEFEVSYTPLNGGEDKSLSKSSEVYFNENGYYVGKKDEIPNFLKFRIEDESGYYKLKVIWKNCPVIVNGFKITQDVEMIIANDNIFCIPNYGSVTINTYYEPKFYMPVKKLWAVNGTASGSGETMASPASLNTLLSTIASEENKLYSINCSKLATVKKSSYGNSYCMYDVTSINNITCNNEKYINIKSTDVDASMVIQSNDGKMIAVANESIAVTKSGDGEAFLPAELTTVKDYDYTTGGYIQKFNFILDKGAKVDILNKSFMPEYVNVYVDDITNYEGGFLSSENVNECSYDDFLKYCFAKLEIGEDDGDDVLSSESCQVYSYDSETMEYNIYSYCIIETTTKYTSDNSNKYRLYYLKEIH